MRNAHGMIAASLSVLVSLVGLAGLGCEQDPVKAAEDAVFQKLECEEVARPSTLVRLRAVLEHPSADTASAFATNPQDVATLVALAGPEAEASVIVTRNVLRAADGAPDLLTSGWDGVPCDEPMTLACTAGEESVAVSCTHGKPTHIALTFDKCTVTGMVIDGDVTLERDGDSGAHAVFSALSIDETKVVNGAIALRFDDATSFQASVRTADGLTIVDHGGPKGGLECGEELRFDVLAFTTSKSGKEARVELGGSKQTVEETYGVATFGDHLHFDGSCGCPMPGSGIAFDMPRPLGKEGAVAHAKVTYTAPDDAKASCAKANVELEGWPTSCSGLGDDCGKGATAQSAAALLTAFCVE